MTTISNLSRLPDMYLKGYTATDEADAMAIAHGRRAWAYCNSLGQWVVFVESEEK
jgi:hypothetical protein